MRLRDFLDDKRGTSFEGIALSVSIIAVAFVASADMLDYMMKKHDQAEIASINPATPASRAAGNLDYSATGSLPTMITRSVLDPCTGVTR